MICDGRYLILLGTVRDKYGDNGNCILLIVRMRTDHEAEIDSFLMSCRIMNHTVEYGFLYEAEKILSRIGVTIIYASYIRTEKNRPASDFYSNAGYELINEYPNGKNYKFDLFTSNRDKRKKCYVKIV